IHGELLKLGLTVSQATVSKYMVWPRRPPSQAWRTFLKNHAPDLIALDFFTVSTATFRVLFVLVILTHSRRRLVHLNVTEHPTAEWTARQLLEACALEEGPRYLIRDRDQVYGERFSRQAKTLDIPETVIAPRSPWQNAYAERVIGSIRPWWTPQNRPYVDGAKAAIGADAQASELQRVGSGERKTRFQGIPRCDPLRDRGAPSQSAPRHRRHHAPEAARSPWRRVRQLRGPHVSTCA